MRILAVVLSITTAWVPWALVWGDAFTDAMQVGQGTGSQLGTSVMVPTTAGNRVQLFPGNAAGDIPFSGLFPGAQNGDAAGFSRYFGNAIGATMQGQQAQAQLTTNTSPTGASYSALRAGVGRSRPDMRNDPLWTQTDDVITHFQALSRTFADCQLDTQFRRTTRNVHIKDLRTCNRLDQLGGSCTLYHDYSVVDRVGITVWGGAAKESCGSGCTRITYTQQTTPPQNMGRAYPAPPDAQTFGFSVTDSRAVRAVVVAISPSPPTFSGFEIDQYTERYTVAFPNYYYYAASPASFVTIDRPAFSADRTNDLRSGGAVTIANDFALRTPGPKEWWRGTAPYIVVITIYHQAQVNDRGWSNSPSCVTMANTLRARGGFCNGTLTCQSPPLDATGCYSSPVGTVCPADLRPAPIAGVNALCHTVTVAADCAGFHQGPMTCWRDAHGVLQCPYNSGNAASDCTALEQNAQCAFLRAACVDGARDQNGTCYLHQETWDCGGLHALPLLSRQDRMNCAGPVRCMGTDCASFPSEQSPDFAKAAAALQAAQLAANDMQCSANAMPECAVFGGTREECKRAVGGIVNCCKTPGTTNLTDYITLVMNVTKLANAGAAVAQGGVVQGAWETLTGGMPGTWTTLQTAYTSAVNAFTGKVTAAASQEAGVAAAEVASQALMRSTAAWAADIFGPTAVNLIFVDAATGGAAVTAGGTVAGSLALSPAMMMVGAVLGVIMWAYLIYQVVMILIKLIWTCEQKEFSLGAKRELKSCVAVGAYCRSQVFGQCIESRDVYCCFTTPLARIIQEQARPQLGRGWGAPRAADCGGLKVAELGALDWTRINLDEWLAILVDTGHFPTAATLTMDNLTGMTSLLSADGQRPNAADRSTRRSTGIDAGQVRKEVGTDGWSRTLPALP